MAKLALQNCCPSALNITSILALEPGAITPLKFLIWYFPIVNTSSAPPPLPFLFLSLSSTFGFLSCFFPLAPPSDNSFNSCSFLFCSSISFLSFSSFIAFILLISCKYSNIS